MMNKEEKSSLILRKRFEKNFKKVVSEDEMSEVLLVADILSDKIPDDYKMDVIKSINFKQIDFNEKIESSVDYLYFIIEQNIAEYLCVSYKDENKREYVYSYIPKQKNHLYSVILYAEIEYERKSKILFFRKKLIQKDVKIFIKGDIEQRYKYLFSI